MCCDDGWVEPQVETPEYPHRWVKVREAEGWMLACAACGCARWPERDVEECPMGGVEE